MSCVEVSVMPSNYHSTLSLHTMNYHPHRHGSWPNPTTAHPHSAPQSSSSSRHALTLQPPTLLTSPSPLSAPHSLASSTSYASSSTSSSRITPSRAAVLQAASPHVQPSQASEIVPRLYISDLSFAENPTLLAKYRITHILSILPERIAYGWTPGEAVKYVKDKRKVANPNFGFVKQLYEYGRESLGRRGLVDGM
ncbi:phosphatases II [Moniliophthora roreri]|nr:phosphatases II [Moniliophthora roreri]